MGVRPLRSIQETVKIGKQFINWGKRIELTRFYFCKIKTIYG